MGIKAILALLSFSNCLINCAGVCDLPCTGRYKVYHHPVSGFDLTAISSSTLEVTYSDGTVFAHLECVERVGAFFILRRSDTNTIACNKYLYYTDNLILIRESAPHPADTPYDFCELCGSIDDNSSDNSNLRVFVAKENTELGCDVPKNCPSVYDDTPCTGCEEGVPDDGYNCGCHNTYEKGHGKQKPGYTHPA